MGLWIKNDDGSIEKVAGSGGAGGSFDGEHVLTGDVDNPPEELDVGQLMWDGVEGGSGGGGGDGGPHNHDYLPLEGGTLTGGLIVGGRLEVANAAIRGYDGNETWPAFTFQSDTRSGVYLQSAGTLCMTANGQKVGSWDFNAIGGRFFGPGHTAGSAIIGERYDDGNDAYPPYRFYGDEKTGFYLKQSGVVGVSGDLQVDGQTLVHKGSGAAPGLAFSTGDSQQSTGMFYHADYLGLVRDGETKVLVYPDNVRVMDADLKVDGNSDITINVPSDYWRGRKAGTIFHEYGGIVSQGSFSTALNSNGYRNGAGTWTNMGHGPGATVVELYPTGAMYVRVASDYPTGSGSQPPIRFTVNESGPTFRAMPSKTRTVDDILERAETAEFPPEDDGVATMDGHDEVPLFEVVSALLAKVKELSARIEELEGN